MANIEALAKFGATETGAVTRLTLTDADKAARDLVVSWMKDLGLEVKIDQIGNIFGFRAGLENGPPVMTGSHLDTVIEGGTLDGPYGILAGLEVIAALNEAKVKTKRPLAVAIFTNEEGVRFQPDMMGSLVAAGGLDLEAALAAKDSKGTTVGQALKDIGYNGELKQGDITPHAFVELHIEQGPILEAEEKDIGVVENLTGISWTEVTIKGVANHAGTTPQNLRKDAGFAAARLIVFLQDLAAGLGAGQRATVGSLNLTPNAINVVPGKAVLTVDLRNSDNDLLKKAEGALADFLSDLKKQGFEVSSKSLVRFDPVGFDKEIAGIIKASAKKLGLSAMTMTSGAGHDAQMMARLCPAAMIFVPSKDGISHNGREFTDPAHLLAGCQTLMHTLLELGTELS